MRATIVVSAAGAFRGADHALCRVHAERAPHELMTATARREKAAAPTAVRPATSGAVS